MLFQTIESYLGNIGQVPGAFYITNQFVYSLSTDGYAELPVIHWRNP